MTDAQATSIYAARIRHQTALRQLTAHIAVQTCPFCGSPSSLELVSGWWQVECTNMNDCGATGAARPWPSQVAECWNRRML